MSEIDAAFLETLQASVTTGSREATEKIEQFRDTNPDGFFASMSSVLGNESIDWPLRQASGLHIKNALSTTSVFLRDAVLERWAQQVSPETRLAVKETSLKTLSTQAARVRMTAAQVIAALAGLELPLGEWQELVPRLLELAKSNTTDGSDSATREAALQALGYISESVSPSVLASQSDHVLNAIAAGANKDEKSPDVQVAALRALLNSLNFVERNFAVDSERNYIMQVVCEATQIPHVAVQVTAFECLVRIVDIYYVYMKLYMEQALYNLTIAGMQHGETDVALQAIEFWSTVCDKEIALEEDIEMGDTSHPYFAFAKMALSQVIPVLLGLLTRQSDDADDDDVDEWNVSMAASTCLTLYAQVARNDILQIVLSFIESNISSDNWHNRDAAVMAFGSILDGPDQSALQPLVSQALMSLIELLQKDSSLRVRESAAWTLGRISDRVVTAVEGPLLAPFVTVLLETLSSATPRIAASCCWALINLAEQEAGADKETAPISALYPSILQTLTEYTEHLVSNDSNVRSSAYEALAAYAAHGPDDTIPLIQQLALTIITRGEVLLTMRNQLVSMDDVNNHEDLQQSICAVLSSVARRLGTGFAPLNDRAMSYLLALLNNTKRGSSLVEQAFICLASIISTQPRDAIEKYIEPFLPHIGNALSSLDDPNLYNVAVGVVADLATTLGTGIVPYLETFMNLLANGLNSPQLKLSIKPHILATMGDMAVAAGPAFEPYLATVMGYLQAAASLTKDQIALLATSPEASGVSDPTQYLLRTRETVLAAYTSILSSIRDHHNEVPFTVYIPQMLALIRTSLEDDDRDLPLVRSAIGLLGDIADAYSSSPEIKPLLREDWVMNMIRDVRQHTADPETRTLAKWAKEMVRQATA